MSRKLLSTVSGILIIFLVSAVLEAMVPAGGVQAAQDEPRPNVIVVLVDDQGWGDLSLNGNTTLETPHIDGLAREGAAFEHFYVQPVCSPTRAELLTGRYHPRGGVYATSAGGERMDLDEHTIGETFREAGYATAVFGKWHNGTQYPYHPNARGFEEFYGFTSGHWGHYFSPMLEHNEKLVRGDGYITDDLTGKALQFMEEHREEPFFVYLPYNTPHSPMQVPDRFYEKFSEADVQQNHRYAERENIEKTRAALAMSKNIDWNIGRILNRLSDLGLSEQTIVVYFSDNGPNGWRWNDNMRGRKGSTDEGGVRVPLFVRWPGEITAGTEISQIAGAVDLLPTLADLAGIPVGSDKPLDGRSLKPLLLGSTDDWPDRRLYAHWGGDVSVRTQRFRLDTEGRLYDLEEDREQRVDVAEEHPAAAETLRAAVDRWDREVRAELDEKDRPFPVGHSESPVTRLPARDGVAHGTIERSNRYPNSSFFRNWTSPDDRITWDIAVHRSGRYEATIYYTCSEENVGTELELSFRASSLRSQVTEPHDPPLIGREEDRIPRIESYVKDFKPMTLGTITLESGRDELVLRAPEIPGAEAVDLRYVELRLVP